MLVFVIIITVCLALSALTHIVYVTRTDYWIFTSDAGRYVMVISGLVWRACCITLIWALYAKLIVEGIL